MNSYVGPPGLQTRFIDYGIGLELNEWPFISQGQSYLLEERMTLAVQPNIVFTVEGSVGIENTVVVTLTGCEILNPVEQDIFQVGSYQPFRSVLVPPAMFNLGQP